ncbi:uncharacterized protein BJ171DRAFT_172759 [Polychytrium aggregatum]|uniref:uncharacterized protein n=1 Tax=Polychytrium aggregatum TaxID=110093 RepID=UPI0022FE1791|nr:uncharacterized protein BJ171DRAFT_172759 [Polychytrium aggregatum]KAI9208988.1 hypothetical protein BJ171DRAFT_172759 [Polychytrium aggregatum]
MATPDSSLLPSPLSRERGSSFSLTTPIIYEVNLSVPKQLSSGYIEYLRAFTKETCSTVDGFTSAQVFSQPKPVGLHWLSEEGDAKAYYTVHYHVESQEHLDRYLQLHQQGPCNVPSTLPTPPSLRPLRRGPTARITGAFRFDRCDPFNWGGGLSRQHCPSRTEGLAVPGDLQKDFAAAAYHRRVNIACRDLDLRLVSLVLVRAAL